MEGKRIRLIHMDDKYAPPDGSLGKIIHVDDMGQIHVVWENGSSLAVIPGVDEYEIIGG